MSSEKDQQRTGSLPDRPRLRRVESFPVSQADGQTLFALRDPEGFSETVALPYQAAVVASLLDGSRTIGEIRADFEGRLGHTVSLADVEKVVRDLDERDYLDTERFRNRWKRAIELYLNARVRPAAHAGRAYPADAAALRKQIAELLANDQNQGTAPREETKADCTAVAGAPAEAGARGTLCGVLSPHVDLRRGGVSIAWACQKLLDETDADLFVVLGTAHNPMRQLFAATKKDFATPLGNVHTDRKFVARLAARMSAGQRGDDLNLMADELAHRQEHSIEFPIVLLQSLLGGKRSFQIVPILVGSFHEFVTDQTSPKDDPRVATLIAALRATVAEHEGRVCYLASGDLAHVGQRFGDREFLDADRLAEQSRHDRELLNAARDADAEQFFRRIAASGDRDRVCGLSPTYVMLEAAQPTQGEVLRYDQAVELDGTGCVSFASAAFYRD